MQSLWGFRSVFYLTTPFSRPPAITLTDTPSGWLENATEQMISRQWTWPIKSPLIVHSLKSLPPPTRHMQRNAEHHILCKWIFVCKYFQQLFTVWQVHGKPVNNKKRTDCRLYVTGNTHLNHRLWRYLLSSHWLTLRSLDSYDLWDSGRNTTWPQTNTH